MKNKGKSRILAFGIILCMLIAMATPVFANYTVTVTYWTGNIGEAFYGGTGTEENPYVIRTAEQLAYLASTVNAGNTYEGKYIILADDIVLNPPDMFTYDENGLVTGVAEGATPREWTPIGYWLSDRYSASFNGTFDGCNHEIKGVYINKPDGSRQGLFGFCADGGGIVKNVGVTGGYILCFGYSGGVIGESRRFSISNCYNTCTVYGCCDVGGVVGFFNTDGTMSNCYNMGTVIGYGTHPGGNSGEIGGVVGLFNGSVEMTNCYNTGKVTVTETSWSYNSGGIAGCVFSYPLNGDLSVTNCYNTGAITGYMGSIGGLFGVVGGERAGVTLISNCYNTGTVTVDSTVTGDSYVGGIAGRTNFVKSYKCDPSVGVVENCYNIGAVSGKNYVGSICGYLHSGGNPFSRGAGHIYYYLGCAKDGRGVIQYGVGTYTQGNYQSDGNWFSGLTYSKIREQASFSGFDFDTVWTMGGNPDYPYPELIGMNHIGGYIRPHTETQVVKNGNNYTVSVENYGFYSEKILVGVYKNNRLNDMKILNAGSITPVTFTGDFDEFKVMAWDNLTTFEPICTAETIPQNNWIIEQ